MPRLALIVLAALALLAAPAHGADRPRFDTRLFALVPAPGYPAHAYVAKNGRVYEGTYDNPQGDPRPSRVLEYTGEGTLLRSWTVEGQILDGPHGVQVATSDHAGRLILLDKNPPRVLRFDPRTGSQKTLASFPAGSVPNYAAWGGDDALYITDYNQPVLWRLKPGAKEPERWLETPLFDGGEFGLTGLELAADRKTLLVAVQSSSGGAAGNPSTGRIYRVAIGEQPSPPQELWESRPADGPDGFAIARSGTIYVANLVSNQIAVIDPGGTERERFPEAPTTGENGSRVPFDGLSSAQFLGTRLITAQQAFFTGNAARQVIHDVETGEPGLDEYLPAGPEKAQAKKKKQKRKKRNKRRSTPR